MVEMCKEVAHGCKVIKLHQEAVYEGVGVFVSMCGDRSTIASQGPDKREKKFSRSITIIDSMKKKIGPEKYRN